MPESAKRFYLCNLIPLWEIDEKDVDVDWPLYHAYFNESIDMKAEVKNRKIRWTSDSGQTPDPDLKIRFEVYESDYLLSGGLNEKMGTFSSHANFGDEATIRPIKIIDQWNKVSITDQEKYIFIRWLEASKTTVTITAHDGTTTTHTEEKPDTLEIRCWWQVREIEDVSGTPEFYYDFYLEGKLNDGAEIKLHERSDHELQGFAWHVTKNKQKGRVLPLVDGEYAFIKMLEVMDQAQHSIHILSWKLDPAATLVLEHQFQGDYLQLPGLTPAAYEGLLVRNKPHATGIAAQNGLVFYTLSNGNLAIALADGSSIVLAIQHRDDPTNLDLPSGLHVLLATGLTIYILLLDQLRSRLLLFRTISKADLQAVAPGVYVVPLSNQRLLPFFEITQTLPAVMNDNGVIAGYIPLAGNGNPGFHDAGFQRANQLTLPEGQLNHPQDVVVAQKTIFISDTDNHCIRKIDGFDPDPAKLRTVLKTASMALKTLAGKPTQAGDTDGSGQAARFREPLGLAFDSKSDLLLVADSGNKKIRTINPLNGTVTTLAITKINGTTAALSEIVGLAFDATRGTDGTLYVTEKDRHRILEVDLKTYEAKTLAGTGIAGYSDGDVASARFDNPTNLAFDDNKVFVTDRGNRVVRVIDLVTKLVNTIGSTTAAIEQDVPVILADVLQRKAREGVAVSVVLDDYGSGISRDNLGNGSLIGISGEQTIADLRFYYEKIHAFVQPHEQQAFNRSLGSNHEKMMIVDGKIGFTGGIDFAPDKNNGLIHKRKHRFSILWHDVAALVEGKAAFGLEQHFERRWKKLREALEDETPPPEKITITDRTDSSIEDYNIESVRTYDRSPVIRVPGAEEVREILESYKRAILAARHYVYMEHQYIYYPELGDFLVTAMQDNQDLQIIWVIPFFTEETRDPTVEKAVWEKQGILADSITDTNALADPRAGGTAGQLRSQIAWHGFFRQREMVEKFRRIDPKRIGIFSIQRVVPLSLDPTATRMEMIYPHTKMILCDDRFFSIGSANANGRGLTKDGEHNISVIAPDVGKALRQRLWGEHLGYMGVAHSDGSILLPLSGHHLSPGAKIQVSHPSFGTTEREVDTIEARTGTLKLTGPPLPALNRILWTDPSLADLPLGDALSFWRRNAHKLDTYRKVKGINAKTNAQGDLIIPDNLTKKDDIIHFGQRIVLLKPDGSAASSNPVLQPHIAFQLKVKSVSGEVIKYDPVTQEVPNVDWIARMTIGDVKLDDNTRPLQIKLLSRTGSMAKIEVKLGPNQENVNFDYMMSWLLRQSGGEKWIRAWEIDPPEGIEYSGPGSVLFSPWLLIPWLFIDFDVDEQA